MTKNETDPAVIEEIASRWSPYRMQPRVVEDDKIRVCLEAARWAASSFNEQPWHWIVARRQDEDAFATMLQCLVEPNRPWASNAGVLIGTVISTHFRRNDKLNRVALHDLGNAAAHLALQATRLGLQAHQMGGINIAQMRAVYQIPEGFEPQTAIAIGYPDFSEPEGELAEELSRRESGPRTRRALGDQVFEKQFGKVASWLA